MKLTEGVKEILGKLRDSGFSAYIVGGAVRNHFLGIPIDDYDVTTSATPEEIFKVFEGYNTFAPGLKHGTVCVEIDKTVYEVTTYRTESGYEDNRHPSKVNFVRDLKQDLSRRDFTINAICFDGNEFVDEFDGRRDLQNKVIRCIGNPNDRFNEDALRILRALRFASKLGFSVEEQTKKAIFAGKRLLVNVSAERIREELNGILCGKACLSVLLEFKEVIAQIIPELERCFGFEQKSRYHVFDVYTHIVTACAYVKATPILRVATLLHDVAKPDCFSVDEQGIGHFYGHAKKSVQVAEKILDRLKYANEEKKRILSLIEYHDYPLLGVDEKKLDGFILRLLNKLGEDGVFDLIEVKKADNYAKSEQVRDRLEGLEVIKRRIEGLLEEKSTCFTLSKLAINGNDVAALGGRGKEIGYVLNALLNAVMSGQENTKDALLPLAKRKLKEIKRR